MIEGAAEFQQRLDALSGVVEKREAALLAFFGEPPTVEEIVEHGSSTGPTSKDTT
ncbi:hypothetical protein [Streptomyces sp. NPDC056983]|uniref:hypothetical protein n=1 Tax=Streptomyces sp. NPDC056983 TaxID=3345987 RepID=UPI00363A6926